MKKIAIVAVFMFTMFATMQVADAKNDNDGVCASLDSGKINTQGNVESVLLTAPEGSLISAYCVKAGSSKQGNGPVYVTLETPVSSLEIVYSNGKSISHYSVSYTRTTPTTQAPPTTITPPTTVITPPTTIITPPTTITPPVTPPTEPPVKPESPTEPIKPVTPQVENNTPIQTSTLAERPLSELPNTGINAYIALTGLALLGIGLLLIAKAKLLR